VQEHDALVCLRPELAGAGATPGGFSLVEAVRAGEAAVTDSILERLRGWASRNGSQVH
jgi:hypothetical protein